MAGITFLKGGISQLTENLQKMNSNQVRNLMGKSVKHAIDPVRKVTAAQYGQKIGKHDEAYRNASEATKAWRWGGALRNKVHPLGESRQAVSYNMMKGNQPKLIPMASGRTAVIGRVWGQTRNAWLLEFGRKDSRTSYKGWGIAKEVFNTMTPYVEGTLESDLKNGFDLLMRQWWKNFAKKPK